MPHEAFLRKRSDLSPYEVAALATCFSNATSYMFNIASLKIETYIDPDREHTSCILEAINTIVEYHLLLVTLLFGT